MCKVVNIKNEECDVYIGRPSKWGNPFKLVNESKRGEVIELYKNYLWQQISQGSITEADLLKLKDKKLGCYCKPLACHGDELKKAVDWACSNQFTLGL